MPIITIIKGLNDIPVGLTQRNPVSDLACVSPDRLKWSMIFFSKKDNRLNHEYPNYSAKMVEKKSNRAEFPNGLNLCDSI